MIKSSKKILCLFISSLFIFTQCHKKEINDSPSNTALLYIKALSDKNGAKIFNLLSKSSQIVLENNTKIFLKNLMLIDPKNKSVEPLLELTGEKFFIQFMSLNSKYLNYPKNSVVKIQDVRTFQYNTRATVLMLINKSLKELNLQKIKDKWYITNSTFSLKKEHKTFKKSKHGRRPRG